MASRQVYVSELVTVDDMANRWKMGVNQVSNLACGRDGRKNSNFPQPLVGKGTRAVWLWSDVQSWYDSYLPMQKVAERRAARKSKPKYRNNSLVA